MKGRPVAALTLALSLLLPALATAAPLQDIGEGFAGGRQPLSAGGRYVVFHSGAADLVPGDTNGADDIFVRDRQTGAVERVSVSSAGVQADRPSRSPSISADGRYVTFSTYDSLAAGDDQGGTPDSYVRDRAAHTTTWLSRPADRAEGPAAYARGGQAKAKRKPRRRR